MELNLDQNSVVIIIIIMMTSKILAVSIQWLSLFSFQCGPQLSMLSLQAGSHIQFDRQHSTFNSVLG